MNRVLGGIAIAALLGGSSLAADIPMGTPTYQSSANLALYTWTGCYVGIQGGAATGRSHHDTAIGPTTNSYDVNGAAIGGTLGCNYQASQLIFGLEGDLSWMGMTGRALEISPFAPTASSETRESWLGTVRGRIGVIVADRSMIYFTGGYAIANVQAHVMNPLAAIAIDVSDAKTRTGWTAGVGIETMVWSTWTAKLEYLYVGFWNASYFDGSTVITPRTGVPLADNIVRVGLNYRFGGAGQ